jgi:hypothetical protein
MGQKHHQTREIGYEYEVSMRKRVSTPKLPKCICYAMHTQKCHYFNSKSCEQDQMNSSGLRDWINHDWQEIFGRV